MKAGLRRPDQRALEFDSLRRRAQEGRDQTIALTEVEHDRGLRRAERQHDLGLGGIAQDLHSGKDVGDFQVRAVPRPEQDGWLRRVEPEGDLRVDRAAAPARSNDLEGPGPQVDGQRIVRLEPTPQCDLEVAKGERGLGVLDPRPQRHADRIPHPRRGRNRQHGQPDVAQAAVGADRAEQREPQLPHARAGRIARGVVPIEDGGIRRMLSR